MAADQQTAAPLASQMEAGRGPAGPAGRQRRLVQRQTGVDGQLDRTCWRGGRVNGDIKTSIRARSAAETSTTSLRRDEDLRQRPQQAGGLLPECGDHGLTLMNTKNPKDSLLNNHPLPNVGRVVITGNPTTGWTWWNGRRPQLQLISHPRKVDGAVPCRHDGRMGMSLPAVPGLLGAESLPFAGRRTRRAGVGPRPPPVAGPLRAPRRRSGASGQSRWSANCLS